MVRDALCHLSPFLSFTFHSIKPVPSPKSHVDPKSFDEYPMYRFSRAFRYIADTRVCSELIRSRVPVEQKILPFKVPLMPYNHGQTRRQLTKSRRFCLRNLASCTSLAE